MTNRKPYIITTHNALAYSASGKPISRQLVEDRKPQESPVEDFEFIFFHPYDPAFFIIPTTGKPDKAAFERGKDFTRQFIVPALHHTLEYHLRHLKTTEHPCIDFLETVPSDGHLSKKGYEDELITHFFRTVLLPNYMAKGESGTAERFELLKLEAEKWLSNATYAKFLADDAQTPKPPGYVAKPRKGCIGMVVPRALLPKPTVSGYIDQLLSCGMPIMPEWLQVITHHQGLVVSTVPANRANKYLGTSRSPIETGHAFHIHLDPSKNNHESIPYALREELIHELQKATPVLTRDTREKKERLFYRFMVAAEPVYNAMKENPHHPALTLIKKTEHGGGSLMTEFSESSMEFMAMEMLVDVVDAQLYLRNNGMNKAQAEAEMEKAFGKPIISLSKEYYHTWIDYAAKLLEKEIGPEKAGQFRKKWMQDPLMHTIELPALYPHYGMQFTSSKTRHS